MQQTLKQQPKTEETLHFPYFASTSVSSVAQKQGLQIISFLNKTSQNLRDEQSQYTQFFSGIQHKPQAILGAEIIQKLKANDIIFNKDYHYEKDPEIALQIKQQYLNFIILKVNITIGPFSTLFLIKFDFQRKHRHCSKEHQDGIIARGGFGEIRNSQQMIQSIIKCIKIDSKEIQSILDYAKWDDINQVCRIMEIFQKKGKMNDMNEQFNQKQKKYQKCLALYRQWQNKIISFVQIKLLLILKQVFFLKIASALGIAPKLHKTSQYFHFLISQNCFSFHMQKCHQLIFLTNQNRQQLKQKLYLLHFLHIVHRDIKDKNIMIGSQGQAYFIDFGGCDLLKNGMNTNDKYYSTVVSMDQCHPDVVKNYQWFRDGNYEEQFSYGNLYFYDMFALKIIFNKNRGVGNKNTIEIMHILEGVKKRQTEDIDAVRKKNYERTKMYIYKLLLDKNISYNFNEDNQIKIKELVRKNREQIMKDGQFMDNVRLIEFSGNKWAKIFFKKIFQEIIQFESNYSYLEQKMQQIKQNSSIKVSIASSNKNDQRKTNISELKYFDKLQTIKIVDIWQTIQFDSLPLMKINVFSIQKYNVQSLLLKLVKQQKDANVQFLEMLPTVIRMLDFKTKKYAVKFQQKVDIVVAVALFLGEKLVQTEDQPLTIIKKGFSFLIDYYQRHITINSTHNVLGFVTLIENAIILDIHKQQSWQIWFNYLLSSTTNLNLKIIAAIRYYFVYFVQYCRPFHHNSLYFNNMIEMIKHKFKTTEEGEKGEQTISFFQQIFKIIKDSSKIINFSKYIQLIKCCSFMDAQSQQYCIKLVQSMSIIFGSAPKKSYFMSMLFDGAVNESISSLFFMSVLFELNQNQQKDVRNNIDKFDQIIDCREISHQCLLIARFKTLLPSVEMQQIQYSFNKLKIQLPQYYQYNNIFYLHYISDFIRDARQHLTTQAGLYEKIVWQIIEINLQLAKKYVLLVNSISDVEFGGYLHNIDKYHTILYDLLKFQLRQKNINNIDVPYSHQTQGFDLFKDFERNGKYTAIYRLEQKFGFQIGYAAVVLLHSSQLDTIKENSNPQQENQIQFKILENYTYYYNKYGFNQSNKYYLFRGCSKILMVMSKHKLRQSDIDGCFNFMKEYLQTPNTNSQSFFTFLMNDLQKMVQFIILQYRAGRQQMLLNLIKLYKQILSRISQFNNQIFPHLILFIVIYQYTSLMKYQSPNITISITQQQIYILQTKIKTYIYNPEHKSINAYNYMYRMVKMAALIHHKYRLEKGNMGEVEIKRIKYLAYRQFGEIQRLEKANIIPSNIRELKIDKNIRQAQNAAKTFVRSHLSAPPIPHKKAII